jgi:hypothetical protein
MKILVRPVGAEMFYADRQTAMTQLLIPLANFANVPKNIALGDHLYWRKFLRKLFILNVIEMYYML